MSTFPSRAMRALSDAGDVRRAIDTRRVMHDRDATREQRASTLYEVLRYMSDRELLARLPDELTWRGMSRASLIAEIIDHELAEPSPRDGEPREETEPSVSS